MIFKPFLDLNLNFIFTVFKNSNPVQNQSNHSPQSNNNGNNSGVFLASPLSSQRVSSPIRMSPLQQEDSMVYGDPTLSTPYRRYKKAL